MSKDIKKALEHCVEWNCDNCPNREELGSGETVCRGRLLPEVLEYVADLEAKLAEKEKEIDILKTALGQASIEAFGKKESFVSSNYPKKIANANEYMEFLIYIASKEK